MTTELKTPLEDPQNMRDEMDHEQLVPQEVEDVEGDKIARAYWAFEDLIKEEILPRTEISHHPIVLAEMIDATAFCGDIDSWVVEDGVSVLGVNADDGWMIICFRAIQHGFCEDNEDTDNYHPCTIKIDIELRIEVDGLLTEFNGDSIPESRTSPGPKPTTQIMRAETFWHNIRKGEEDVVKTAP